MCPDGGCDFLGSLAMKKKNDAKNRNGCEEKYRMQNAQKTILIWIALKAVCSAFNVNRGQV